MALRPTRRRAVAVLVLIVVLVGGLTVDRFVTASVPLVDVLYADFVYVLIVVVTPRAASTVVAVAAAVFCAGIELLQLTRVPAGLSTWFPPARLVLGSTFALDDLAAYAIGVAGAVATDLLIRRRRRPSA